MTALTNFAAGARCAVFGASGGIGAAFCDAFSADPRVSKLYIGARHSPNSDKDRITGFAFDLLSESSIAAAAATMAADGPFDVVVVATGVLHSGEMQPEKSWKEFTPDAFARAFAVNATGPALIAKHVLPLLSRERKSVFAVLSARVGSIEDNRLGGWTAYRASKAALHQIVRTCAIELARKNKHAVCVALHPGTVDTPLSKPFQRGVPAEQLFTPTESAEHLLRVIDRLTPADSGGAFAWDGARIPF